jgi:hypothetical protein
LTIEELAKKLEVGVYRVASQVVKNDLILFDRQFVDAVHSYYARVKD